MNAYSDPVRRDILFIGPATRDVNIDYTGAEDHNIGGAVYFGQFAARTAGARVAAAVKMSPDDSDIVSAYRLPEEDFFLLPSEHTTLMQNTYFTPDREQRKARCLAQSDAIFPAQLPNIPWKIANLSGLLYGDYPDELFPYLKERGKIAADAQAFLRHNEDGILVFHDWGQKHALLPYLDFLKTDAAEAKILTGTDDRREAARILHEWGAEEVVISHHSEILAYDGSAFSAVPLRARNLSGRTGRGDTIFGTYLARRALGDSLEAALLFAAGAVSLKMETPGPLRGDEETVRRYLRLRYPEW